MPRLTADKFKLGHYRTVLLNPELRVPQPSSIGFSNLQGLKGRSFGWQNYRKESLRRSLAACRSCCLRREHRSRKKAGRPAFRECLKSALRANKCFL